MTIADRIWPALDVEPDQEWIDLLASRHGADVVPLDFAGDADASRDIINDWVADRTEDLIPELVPEGVIGPNTVLVLTDTLYFNADLERPFGQYDPSTATSGPRPALRARRWGSARQACVRSSRCCSWRSPSSS